jgi:Na+-driven multidrug efflux pump
MAVAITIFARPMMGIFTDEPDVVTAGIPLLMFNCWGFLIHAFGNIYGSALRGVRKSNVSMIISLVGGCAPKIIWVMTVMKVVHTPIALYCVYPVGWVISSTLMFLAYRHHFKKLTLQVA